ncbi:hypothetical protein GCM10017710_35990 [Arthrobacter ramosus]
MPQSRIWPSNPGEKWYGKRDCDAPQQGSLAERSEVREAVATGSVRAAGRLA